jgi:hypothetical protein
VDIGIQAHAVHSSAQINELSTRLSIVIEIVVNPLVLTRRNDNPVGHHRRDDQNSIITHLRASTMSAEFTLDE